MIQKINKKPVRICLGILGVIALFQTLGIVPEAEKSYVAVTNSFFGIWISVLSAIVFERVARSFEGSKKREVVAGFLYSLALSFALVLGKSLETVENFNVGEMKNWIYILILTLYFAPFVCYAWKRLEKFWKKCQPTQGEKADFNNRKEFLRYWFLIFLCWIPVFLAFYPGAFVYDATDEYVQVATRTFTTHHPLAHVLLLGGMVCAGNKFFDSYNIGIAMYTICQMILLSGVFSYTVCFVKKKINCKYITWGTVLFYGLFPVIPMYAVCSAKDGIFTAAFLLVVIKMLQLLENTAGFLQNRGNIVVSIVAAVIMMLFRNNGMYAYVVWIPIIVIISLFLKKDKKEIIKIVILMTVSVLLFLGSSKVLTLATNADDSESQEIMTVPIQQMVRTYHYSPDTYSEEEKEILYEIIPQEDLHLYNARISDLVKSKFNNVAFNANRGKYLQLWAKIGLRKPMIYLNAWLMTSYGYWYPDAVINVYGGNAVHTFTYRDSSYFGFETEYPGTRESKFPWLEEQYRRISLELYQQKVPGVSMLFSPGFLFWVFVFCFVCFIQKGKWNQVLGFAGVALLWATAILGPTYLVRYVLILWFVMPVALVETK
ncbi:MAG: hypothetical protein IKW30_10285 [Lachnospiraceae bacterium]|nr:hypothetical protein [Lachnospiraceae bacterium]